MSNEKINFKTLIAFEASARLLSFTGAARELGTTQPAVSQQISSLEQELGTALFRRIYRGVELTDEGHMLFVTTQTSLQDITAVIQKIKQRNQSQRITFATDFALAAYWLVPTITRFRQAFPHIDIRLETAQSSSRVIDAETDIAILFGDGHFQGCHSELLFTEQVCPVYSPLLVGSNSRLTTLEAICEQPLLRLNSDNKEAWIEWESLFDYFSTTWQPPEVSIEFDNYTLLVQAALSGQGVALGWTPLLDEFIQRGALIAEKQFTARTSQGYYLVIPDKQKPTAEVRLFIDWLKRERNKVSI
ncbi:choline sulfate utilization transcriptional regulator [Vibrio nitrifigilis]|uniref:LysR family transcriptional regulator n=1 Tax=Vibrio nitrifigilis TaxID=2789781 RepID=A0ABS0GJ39_9VIBR|nr:LysR substrate-binding domain-containing protein [Vibrio nitrifigilis]MBF9002451.1 LysR family transcriptional regulator [Vibrio nitrifigilis]